MRHSEHLTRMQQLEEGRAAKLRNIKYVRLNHRLAKYMRAYQVNMTRRSASDPSNVWLVTLPYLDRVQYLLSDTDSTGLRSRKSARYQHKHVVESVNKNVATTAAAHHAPRANE
ncbi:unnamed protein product, partial [Anisakis simplex]|uniref:Transposase n=1 Tax=Anisakis simplex TaxID=6269 RepID=A0A0M3JN47_ANISI